MNLKEVMFKIKIDKGLMLYITILFVASILMVSTSSPSFSALVSAEDADEEEVPEWYKGDKWTYQMREPFQEGIEIVTEVEKEVVDEMELEVDVIGDERGEIYETYVVEERHVRELEDEEEDEPIDDFPEIKSEFCYTKEHLSPIFTHPEGAPRSFYYPPIIEMDFPLHVGKEWIVEEGGFFEDTNPDEDEAIEPSREVLWYNGTVEERVTKEVPAGEFDDVFLINLTIIGRDLETDIDPLEYKRFEIYYSPEVKNIIHRDIYETRRVPEDEDDMGWEESVGTETLLDYYVQDEPPEGNGDNDGVETPFLGAGTMVLLVLGAASIYYFKKYIYEDRQE